MEKKRKRLSLFVVCILGVMVFALSSCTALALEWHKIQIGVFLYKYDDPYIQTVKTSLLKEFEPYKDRIKLNFYNGQGVQADQSMQLDTALYTSDLFIVNVVDNQSDAGKQIAKKISNAESNVIFFNREIPDSVLNINDNFSYIGTDPNKPGYMIGEMIADMIPNIETFKLYDRNGDGKLGYAMLRAEVGNPEADGRTKYSVEEANRLLKEKLKLDYDPLVLVGKEQMCDWDTAKAESAMSNLLGSDEDKIDLVIANNDGMAFGAVTALVKQGFNLPNYDKTDNSKYIPVFGVDGLSQAIEYIKSNQMAGTVKQDADAMAEAIRKVALNLLENKGLLDGTDYKFDEGTRKLRIPYTKITAADVKK